MSKIIDRVRAEQHPTARRASRSSPLVSVEIERVQPSALAADILYQIQVRLGAKVWLSESVMAQSKDAVPVRIRQVRQLIAEEIFGEFRPMLAELQRCVLVEDRDAALVALSMIQDRMFNVDGEIE